MEEEYWTNVDYDSRNSEKEEKKEKKSESGSCKEDELDCIPPIQHHMEENIEYPPTPPPPGSRMREFRFVNLESLIEEVFSEADRTMGGEQVTQYSVWSTFKTKSYGK